MDINRDLPLAEALLSQANGGKTILAYRRNKIVFLQGEPADAVFYIQEGEVKLAVLSGQGKEAVVAILGIGDFCGEGCWPGSPFVWRQPRQLRNARSCGWRRQR